MSSNDKKTPAVPTKGHAPSAQYATTLPDGVEALIVPLFAGEEGLELVGTGLWDMDVDVELWEKFSAVGATGAVNEISIVPAGDNAPVSAVVGVGLGSEEDLTAEILRRAAGVAARASRGFTTVATTLGAFGMGAAVEGFVLGGYTFTGYRAEKKDSPTTKRPVDTVVFLAPVTLAATVDQDLPTTADGSVDVEALAEIAEVVEPAGGSGLLGKKGKKGSKKAGKKAKKAKQKTDNSALAEVAARSSKEEFVAAVIAAEAVVFARDLVNTAPLELYPASYAAAAKAAAEEHGLSVEILDDKQLAADGYGGLIAVGQGSSRGPRLVRISYAPKKATNHVALVGKGITFDTGGISLKPGKGMSDMTCDMAGSAAVIAAIIAAARLNLKVAVTATVPLAENMPGGNAQRPGDVIRHYGGLTSEVLNTDAEGRLVLADAIARACEDKPDYLIETATLTGAQMSALGLRTTGAMGSDEFRDRVTALGRSIGENTWAMEIPEEVRADVTGSEVADVRNIAASPYGGMQAAAAYLEAAVTGDVQWVHLDVAGPAWNGAKTHGYTPGRGTGVPVRTIIAVLEDIAAFG